MPPMTDKDVSVDGEEPQGPSRHSPAAVELCGTNALPEKAAEPDGIEALRERAEYLELSERALKRLTAMYQAVLRSMSHGVVVADPNGKFLLFNDAAERILGLGPLDVPACDWSKHYGCYLPDRVTPYPSSEL